MNTDEVRLRVAGLYDMLGDWLVVSAVGIVFALFPTWVWCGGRAAYAVLREEKKLPSWMLRLARGGSASGKIKEGALGLRFGYFFGRALAALWMTACFGLYQWGVWSDVSRGPLLKAVVIETSFPLFLILTFLVPVCLLEHFLRRLPASSKPVGL